MAKPIKIWTGSEWVEVAVSIPNLDSYATSSSVTSAISAHESDTTNVHGIADTSQLITSSTLSSHTSATINIHGIANTALLATTATIDNEELLIIAGAL